MSEKRKALLFRLLMALGSLLFLLLFARSSSPLTPRENGWDAAFFRLVGQRMTEGYLPYRDFFDMKGPYLFLLEYLGQLLVRGRIGALILEWVHLTASLLIACRIFDRLKIRKYLTRILLLLPCLWMAMGTFEGGNMTEELSLPVLFLCLDLWLKHYLDQNSAGVHPPKYAAIYGACFIYLALIRVTNAALIGAFVLALCVELIARRSWKCLGLNALAFISGAVLVFLPPFLFFAANGLAGEMLYQVFVFGFKYGTESGFLASMGAAFSHPEHYLFLILPLLLLAVYRIRDQRLILPVVFASLFTLLACLPGHQFTHYFTLGIPVIILSGILIVLHSGEKQPREKRNILAVALMIIALLCNLRTAGGSILYTWRALFVPGFTTTEGISDVAAQITPEERDKVFCYDIDAYWYVYADLNPYVKYCGWHSHYIELEPSIEADLESILKQDPPACVVLKVKHTNMPQFLKKMLKKEYTETYRNDQYVLMKRTAAAD